MTELKTIISEFDINGAPVSLKPFGSGHINDTYRVATDKGCEYLLQKINHFVFKNVAGLTNNIVLVTNHLKEKINATAGSNADEQVLTPIKHKSGAYFIEDTDGNFWRVFVFLSDTKSYDQVLTEQQALEGGKAFGRFQSQLADLDPLLIVDTIPDFHNIEFRLANLDSAIIEDKANRLKLVLPEIEFINARRTSMANILEMGRKGELPQRIIHNDTKFNNVLLDKDDKAQCVIDLDTVMPGYVAYDFGDAVRTIINTGAEDEPDITLINLNIPLFAAYVEGYVAEAGVFLTKNEIESLIEGVLLLPYMQGVRFLTDYLNSDVYFKIHSPEHNLQRAKAQFQLVKRIEENKMDLNNIILNTWHEKIN